MPPPTASEAAFETLLAHFDGEVASAPRQPEPSPAGAVIHSEADEERAYLDALFARSAEFLVRDRYGSIGQASDFFTKVVGITFERRQDVAAGLVAGSALELVRDPDNPNDPNAIEVRFGKLQVGFIRRAIAKHIAPNIDAGDRYSATIGSVTGGGPNKNVGVNIYVRRRPRLLPAARDGASGGSNTSAAAAPDVRELVDRIRYALIGDRPLRSHQRAVLERIGAGHNTLAVFGTGRGKSLCFQLPAAERALRSRQKTLVFYPLRALANDQHDALARKLEPLGVRVLRANGSLDGDERAALELALEDGSWDIVLATPEFAAFHRAAFTRDCNRPSFVVVDEAHHLYESKHRPAYVALGELLTELGRPQILALTATAHEAAFREIRRALGIDAWVIDPTVRENLRVVDARGTKDKERYLERELSGSGKAIVYCMSRERATKIAARLRRGFGEGVGFYHAGMPTPERAAVEEMFRKGFVRIVTATSAFGEGIDLPDVRDVVLYHLNFALTEFNQQAGRAGRDGEPARIHLLYGEEDRGINDFLIAQTAPSIPTLRELYRGMRGLASDGTVRLSYADVARTLELKLVDERTVSAAVRIWQEAGLVETGRDDDGRFVRLRAKSGKVDLRATAGYAEGEAEREQFERFCKLACDADAAVLEAIVNRPIYPERVPLER